MNSLQMVFMGLCFISLGFGLVKLISDDWTILGSILWGLVSVALVAFGAHQVWDGLGQIAI